MRVPPIIVSGLLALVASLALAGIAAATSREIVVHLSAAGFVPASSTISVGDRVRFTVRDRKPHQLSKVSGPDSGEVPPSVLEAKGSSATLAFSDPGTYTYLDRLNPGRHEYRVVVRRR